MEDPLSESLTVLIYASFVASRNDPLEKCFVVLSRCMCCNSIHHMDLYRLSGTEKDLQVLGFPSVLNECKLR